MVGPIRPLVDLHIYMCSRFARKKITHGPGFCGQMALAWGCLPSMLALADARRRWKPRGDLEYRLPSRGNHQERDAGEGTFNIGPSIFLLTPPLEVPTEKGGI